MNSLVKSCFNFLNDCEFDYAICGGLALELFLNREIRNHIDIDIFVFDKDREKVATYFMERNWQIFTTPKNENILRKAVSPIDKNIFQERCIYAMKPAATIYELKKTSSEENIFSYTLKSNQKKFDFVDIRFNYREENRFICGSNREIERSVDKAVLYHNDIPYLAPELILFLKSQTYLEAAYFKKAIQDFNAVVPLLSEESIEWLIHAIDIDSLGRHKWLEKLKGMKSNGIFK